MKRMVVGLFMSLAAVAGGVGGVKVSAVDLRGSSTLEPMVDVLLATIGADCGGGGNSPPGDLVYVGTGSSSGQASLIEDRQEISPMSRAMNSGVCSEELAPLHANATRAEGIVFALDGVSIVAHGSFASCAGSPTCNTDFPRNGLRNSGQIPGTSFTVADWRDALRILYMGTTSSTLADRNCGSAVRAALATNWNGMFQSCNSGNCPMGIQHAFRRNDGSGTTDTFVSLLGVPSIDLAAHISPFCNTRTMGAGGVTTWGEATKQTLVNPAEVMPPPAAGRTSYVATNITVCRHAANGYIGSNFTDFQDGDVIRRPCTFTAGAAKEDVCSARGDLGLVLPIWDAPQADAFPTKNCTTGQFACFPQPRTNCFPPNTFETCPNGHDPNIAGLCPVGQCAAPIFTGGGQLDPRCYAARGTNAPGDLVTVVYDGRVHNLTTWTQRAGNFVKATAVRATGLPPPIPAAVNVGMTGAYYRIHSINSIAAPTVQCRSHGATDQIGCLVRASPCSIGVAGSSAVQGNTIALNVDNFAPTNDCVQNLVDGSGAPYPLSHKLYLNTLDGFESLTVGAPQYRMARCFANGTASSIAPAYGLTPLPSGMAPFCEDFDETQPGCFDPPGPNSNACANNPF